MEFSSVYTRTTNIPVPASAWLSVNVSLSGIEDEFGSNPNRAPDAFSSSPFPSDGSPRYLIVLVEDNPADVFLVREAIATHNIFANVLVIRDGEEAIRLISRADMDDNSPCPELFLLDLNIPTKNGEEVLSHIRTSRRCSTTPVVVMTSSDSPKDRAKADALGANRYFHKPCDYDAFIQIGEIVKQILHSGN